MIIKHSHYYPSVYDHYYCYYHGLLLLLLFMSQFMHVERVYTHMCLLICACIV